MRSVTYWYKRETKQNGIHRHYRVPSYAKRISRQHSRILGRKAIAAIFVRRVKIATGRNAFAFNRTKSAFFKLNCSTRCLPKSMGNTCKTVVRAVNFVSKSITQTKQFLMKACVTKIHLNHKRFTIGHVQSNCFFSLSLSLSFSFYISLNTFLNTNG